MQKQQITKDFDMIMEDIGTLLDIQNDLDENDNLLEMGLSSIQIMQLAAKWRRSGLNASFVELISNPTIRDWHRMLLSEKDCQAAQPETAVDMYQPFPLSDVQYAYWIGRSKGQYLGGVGCHGYLEIDGKGIDAARLNQAFMDLQMHHPMLRAQITKDGRQQIRKKPYQKEIKVYDFRERDAREHLSQMREELSHRLLDIHSGQVISLQLTLLPKGQFRLHYDIDLLIADVTSFQIIIQDLVKLYKGEQLDLSGRNFNFAQYLDNIEKNNHQKFLVDKAYWQQRLPKLPGKPELPLINHQPDQIKFTRRQRFLEPCQWELFKQNCRKYQITPAIVLLTLYSKVIASFSETPRFLMNIPLFNRSDDVQNIEKAVADFTTLLLIEIDFSDEKTFLEEVRTIWQEFTQGMNHINYSGVKVQRDYLKMHSDEKTVAPVVYSCNLGFPLIDRECQEIFGNITYMISQTPQVWLDFQVFDIDDGLMIFWDSIDELFPEGLLDTIFDKFNDLLIQVIEQTEWRRQAAVSIEEQLEARKEHCIQSECGTNNLIHQAFFETALEYPDRIALIDSETETAITYQQLRQEALKIAGTLRQRGMKKGDVAGVCLKRGKEQIASVLGILATGGSYVTLGVRLPVSRQETICSLAGIEYVISEDGAALPEDIIRLDIKTALNGPEMTELAETDAQSLAYIIFTSGSTGNPKGVMIRHAAAYNTIYDINNRFGIDCHDTVLAVSAMDFDLSVYDVFGLLSVGGKVVLLPQDSERDGAEMLRRVTEHQVTVFNAVPALLDLFLLMAEEKEAVNKQFKIALISGDWISLGLPKRFYRYAPKGLFVSLGGATEGSIWSNYYEVKLPLGENWSSIPYGFPLTNQKYRVVNSVGQDCPDWVSGELWIGGAGIADGYIGNERETKRCFVNYQGERWYRTGDYGRFWPEGIIEFLGRRDYQIKIRGHRIEIKDIVNQYLKHPAIDDAEVVPLGEAKHLEGLAAFLVPTKIKTTGKDNCFDELRDSWRRISDEMSVTGCAESEAKLRSATAAYIIQLLVKRGMPTAKDELYMMPDEHKGLEITQHYEKLVGRWLQLLTDEQLIAQEPTGAYRNLCDLTQLETDGEDRELSDFLAPILKHGMEIVTGKINVIEAVYSDSDFSIENYANTRPGAAIKNQLLQKIIYDFLARREGGPPLSLMILGARNVENIMILIAQVSAYPVQICLADSSNYFLQRAKEQLEHHYYDISYQKITEQQLDAPLVIEQRYDVITAFDFLHQYKNLMRVLPKLKNVLCRGGLLAFSEITENSAIQLVSTALLEEGFSRYQDDRKGKGEPLLSADGWHNYLKESGYHSIGCYQPVANIEKQAVFTAINLDQYAPITAAEAEHFLQQCVPEYMVPGITVILDEIPFTTNGKRDIKLLQNYLKDYATQRQKTLPTDKLQQQLAQIWSEVLRVKQVYLEDDFYALGGDSLLATKIKIMADKKLGCEIPLDLVFTDSVFAIYAEHIGTMLGSTDRVLLPEVEYRPQDQYQPFPLTDVQQSYWIGRLGGYELGNVSSHCYFEMDCERLDIENLERAWNELIINHPIMRTVILSDGSGQVVLPRVDDYKITESVCGAAEDDNQEAFFAAIRQAMAAKNYDSSQWPLFELRCSHYGNGLTRLHMSFDNIVYDGFSIFHLFAQWKKIYYAETVTFCRKLTFRDYVLTLEAVRKTKAYQDDLAYWKDRAQKLPLAPQLQLREPAKDSGFQRFEFQLDKNEWQKIARIAERHHLTLAVIFMAAYAEVLARYSSTKHFTLNLTRFQKLPLDPEVQHLVGDFTTLTLLEINHQNLNTFLERCSELQKQLHQDMKHSLVSGVEVERELNRQKGQSGLTMPVVFTSGFGLNEGNEEHKHYLGNIIYGESQTPQVWLDHQISIQNGRMFLSWDAVTGMFPEGLIADMFQVYQDLIYNIMKEQNVIRRSANLIQLPQISAIEYNNHLQKEFGITDLVRLFAESAKHFPYQLALQSEKKCLSYRELDEITNNAAFSLLKNKTVKKPIAIIMEKGYQQVVAALSILKAGSSYVPIDAHNPIRRIVAILKQCDAQLAIIDDSFKSGIPKYLDGIKLLYCQELYDAKIAGELPQIEPENDAYVVFTSGSTGTPKGVVISHRAVLNTILDINERYRVTSEDTTIMLSNLNFDLSVYDIFGMFAVGGTVVIPEHNRRKDPKHWIDLISHYGVTIWNSVPAFMQMLMEYQTNRKEELYQKIRLVLLSGDWIPVNLPAQIRQQLGTADIIALGGATEASIWSNAFKIPAEVPQEWPSIPYGRPLANQGFLILNADGEKTPVWVPGELYIYGDGLAKGYINDPDKTKQSFLMSQHINGRIYKTGDCGRYLPDGNIQFLGRSDSQIKRGGHRIELGEIETSLINVAGIKEAVVTFITGDDSSLTANIISDDSAIELIHVDTDDTGDLCWIAAEPIPVDRAEQQRIEDYKKAVEDICRVQICQDMIDAGVTSGLEKATAFADIVRAFGIDPQFHGLFKQYLQVMVQCGILTETISGYLTAYDWRKKIADYSNSHRPDASLQTLTAALRDARPIRWSIISGHKDAKELLVNREQRFLYPEQLRHYDVSNKLTGREMLRFVQLWAGSQTGTVMEIGSRIDDRTKQYAALMNKNNRYIYTDESLSYLEQKQAKLRDCDIEFYLYRPGEDEEKFAPHSVAMIIADNTLHRFPDLDQVLAKLRELLIPGGLILIHENTTNALLMLETTAYLEEGYSNLKDERSKRSLPLISGDEWALLAARHQFSNCKQLYSKEEERVLGKNIMILKGPKQLKTLDEIYLKKELIKYLPEYMIPSNYVLYQKFPLNANGKVDRQKMKKSGVANSKSVKQKCLPQTVIEKQFASIWEALLNCKEVDLSDNFFELGGDSLKAIHFINQVKQETGYEVALQTLTNHPILADLIGCILALPKTNITEDEDEDGWEEIAEI